MSDLAVLSIKVDSSGVEKGNASLKGLTGSAGGAETATEKLTKAFTRLSKGGTNFEALAAATQKATASTKLYLGALGLGSATLEAHERQLAAVAARMKEIAARSSVRPGVAATAEAARAPQPATAAPSAPARAPGASFVAPVGLSTVGAQATATARAVEESAGRTEVGFGRIQKAFLGISAGVAGFAVLTSAVRASTEESLRFSTAMAQVGTVLGAGQINQLGALTENVRALGLQFGSSATDQARALYEIISAGASDAAQATEILTTSNKLAIGGVTDVQTAADGLTTVMATYGSQLRDTTQASDIMFQAAADGKTTIGEMSRFFGRVLPIAAQMGVSFQEVAAATAALTKSGQHTATAMQGLRAILAQVAKPSKEAAELAAALGIQFNVASVKALGFAGFLQMLREKTHGNTEQLALLMGGVEALLPAMTLTGTAAKDFADSLERVNSSSGKAEDAFSRMMDTPEAKLKRLGAAIDDAKVSLGNMFVSAAGPAAESLVRNFDAITSAASTLAKAMVVLTAARVASWASDWAKGLASKLVALNASRAATLQSALAEAGYAQKHGESARAALLAASASLELRAARLAETAQLEGPYTVAHTRAAIAANALAQAKVKEALATQGASVASRAGAGALALFGGPVGAAIAAVTALTMIFSALSARQEEARQASMRWSTATADSAEKASQLIATMRTEFEVINDPKASGTEQARATNAAMEAKEKLLALGPEYRAMFGAETRAIEEEIAAYKELNKQKLIDLDAKIATAEKKRDQVKPSFASNFLLFDKEGDFDLLAGKNRRQQSVAEQQAPFEEQLNKFREDRIRIQAALNAVEDAGAGAKKTKTEEDAARASAQAILDTAKAKQEAAKRSQEWVVRLEEEARGLGLTREQQLRLSDEYRKLGPVLRARAEDSIRAIEAHAVKTRAIEAEKKAQEEASRAAEEAAQRFEHLNAQLTPGAALTAQYNDALVTLFEAMDRGMITQDQFAESRRRVLGLYTEEGQAVAAQRKELDELAKQFGRGDEGEKRLAKMQMLLIAGRVSAKEYREEWARIHKSMGDGIGQVLQVTDMMTSGIADGFANMAASGKLAFSDMVSSILRDVARMMAAKGMAQLINIGISAGMAGLGIGTTPNVGASMSGVSFGSAAGGGTAHMGQALMVGERGPELFVPHANGTVIPNGGGGAVNVPISINISGGESSTESAPSSREDANAMARGFSAAMKKTIVEEMRPGGSLYTFVKGR